MPSLITPTRKYAKTPTPERLPPNLVPYTVPVGAALFEKTVAKIEEKHFKRVKIPVAITIQEAHNIVHFARRDREELIAKGFDWALVEDIQQRCEFLRDLECRVWEIRFGEWPVKKEFEACEAEATQVCRTLMQDMEHAFEDSKGLLGVLEDIKFDAEGSQYSSVLGGSQPPSTIPQTTASSSGERSQPSKCLPRCGTN